MTGTVDLVCPFQEALAVADRIGIAVAAVVFALLLFTLVLIVVLLVRNTWGKKQAEIGTIRCRRCHYIGLAKPKLVGNQGIFPVCGRCGSEDWETVRQIEVFED
jgi:hypothetical protein